MKYYVLDENKNKVEAYDKEGVIALIEKVIADGSLEGIEEDTAFVSKIKSLTSGGTFHIDFVTQAKYNELENAGALVADTYYFITDDNSADDIDNRLDNINSRYNDLEGEFYDWQSEINDYTRTNDESIEDLERDMYDMERDLLNIIGKSVDVHMVASATSIEIGTSATAFPIASAGIGKDALVTFFFKAGAVAKPYSVPFYYNSGFENAELPVSFNIEGNGQIIPVVVYVSFDSKYFMFRKSVHNVNNTIKIEEYNYIKLEQK